MLINLTVDDLSLDLTVAECSGRTTRRAPSRKAYTDVYVTDLNPGYPSSFGLRPAEDKGNTIEKRIETRDYTVLKHESSTWN